MKNEKTAGEWVAEGNELARRFYEMDGSKAPGGFKFYESDHTHAQANWMLAVIAYRRIAGVDLDDYLAELQAENHMGQLKRYTNPSVRWAVAEIERLRGEITG